jgi:hypothetical protein
MIDLSHLYQYCNQRQLDHVQAVELHGSNNKAAKALGIPRRGLDRSVAAVRAKASTQGLSPEHQWTHPVPGTHVAQRVSTYYEKTETSPAAWVIGNLKQEAYNTLIKSAIGEFLEDVAPITVAPAPIDVQGDIIPWIQIGDAHIGMLAHAAETNENFDLKIAEQELCTAIGMLIDEMPNCERIVINDLGDATHYDNITGTTAQSGHQLDFDGRHPKMLRVYSRTMRFIVDKVLEKARFVDVIINQGNHSRVNDFWMRELLTVAYGHTGRVTVLDNDNVFIPYRMGNTFVMTSHSDKCPPTRLVGVMTADYRKDFGETEHHLIDTGHVHHHFVSKEYPSVIIESWNHLAANEKYSHDNGWRSRKSITVLLRSKTYGDVGRRVLPIQEIRDKLARMGKGRPQPARAVHTV